MATIKMAAKKFDFCMFGFFKVISLDHFIYWEKLLIGSYKTA